MRALGMTFPLSNQLKVSNGRRAELEFNKMIVLELEWKEGILQCAAKCLIALRKKIISTYTF